MKACIHKCYVDLGHVTASASPGSFSLKHSPLTCRPRPRLTKEGRVTKYQEELAQKSGLAEVAYTPGT